jgi:hypothetical protein
MTTTRQYRAERVAPVTIAHIRAHGCRDLLVYCSSGRYHHSACQATSGIDPPAT